MSDIWERRAALERKERKMRSAWLDQYHETSEYKQYLADMAALREECQ